MSQLLDVRAAVPDLSSISTEELRDALALTLDVSALHIVRMSLIWQELERRGVDLSALKSGLFTYLPAIAAGKLDAGLVVSLAGKPSLLARIGELTLDEQRSLAKTGFVPLASKAEDGTVYVKNVPIELLSVAQVNKVFVGGRMRAPEEQTAAERVKPAPKQVEWLPGGFVKIGRHRARIGDILEAMPPMPSMPNEPVASVDDVKVWINLDEERQRRLKARAALAGLSMQQYIIRVLHVFGTFDEH